MGERLTDTFMLLFCEKNSDGTKNLVMKGKDIWQRIQRHLKAKDMHKISYFLQVHPEVIGLNLCYNKIGDMGLEILITHCLNEIKTLKDLNLMMCDLTDKSLDLLIKHQIQLRSLRINGNKIGPEGGKILAMLVAKSDSLLHLDIAETDQTLSSIQYYIQILNKHYKTASQLRVLDISRIIPTSNRYPYDSAHLAASLGNMLACNETLIELHLQKNQLDGHDLELMLAGLQKNKSLLMLDVGYNKIADYGVERIGEYIKTKPQLLGLNIAGNSISNIGGRVLSFTMPYSRIRLLDIGFNNMTDEGLVDILNSLKKRVMMRMLNLWGNTFSHHTNSIIKRMVMSGVLDQEYLDVKIYEVDKVYHAAFYPSDHYKHKYYNVMDYACATELKIKRNHIPSELDQPRELVNFKFYPRLPAIRKRAQSPKK